MRGIAPGRANPLDSSGCSIKVKRTTTILPLVAASPAHRHVPHTAERDRHDGVHMRGITPDACRHVEQFRDPTAGLVTEPYKVRPDYENETVPASELTGSSQLRILRQKMLSDEEFAHKIPASHAALLYLAHETSSSASSRAAGTIGGCASLRTPHGRIRRLSETGSLNPPKSGSGKVRPQYSRSIGWPARLLSFCPRSSFPANASVGPAAGLGVTCGCIVGMLWLEVFAWARPGKHAVRSPERLVTSSPFDRPRPSRQPAEQP